MTSISLIILISLVLQSLPLSQSPSSIDLPTSIQYPSLSQYPSSVECLSSLRCPVLVQIMTVSSRQKTNWTCPLDIRSMGARSRGYFRGSRADRTRYKPRRQFWQSLRHGYGPGLHLRGETNDFFHHLSVAATSKSECTP